MIVRISNEGQYDVPSGEQLSTLDDAAVAAAEAGDERAFREAYASLLAYVRDNGTPVADDDIATSELILPPPDVTLAEARTEFTGEGLIPD